jgi:uncharacterized protein (TIGR03905 family)
MTYKTQGVCAKEIYLDIGEDGIVKSVTFSSGCDGNGKGIGRLVAGMRIADVIERVKGVQCGTKGTSCPDQLALALEHWQGLQSS